MFQRVILVLAENQTNWNNFCPSRKQYCIIQLLLSAHRTNALTWGHVTCQLPKLCLKSNFSLSFFHKEFVIGRWWCNAVHNKPIKAFLCADGKRSGNMDTSAIYTSQILMHIHTVQRQGKSRQTPWQISAWISFLLESKLFQHTGASFPPQTVATATATLRLCLPSFVLHHHEQEMCVNVCICVCMIEQEWVEEGEERWYLGCAKESNPSVEAPGSVTHSILHHQQSTPTYRCHQASVSLISHIEWFLRLTCTTFLSVSSWKINTSS